jgi:flagellar basal-body rod modification protein FlgD
VIDPITSPEYYGGTNTSSGTASKATLDKDAFMKLLVAQLRHQDPLSPLQPDQMAAQLAQFTSVEQLTQLNASMTTQTQASQLATLSSQSSLSASLIGREIEAVGDQVLVPSSGQAQVLVDVAGTGGNGVLTLTDSLGTVIATRNLGSVKPGQRQAVKLPADLPPGTWHYKLDVTATNDTKATVTTYSTGVVSAVEFKNGDIVLHAGGLEISLSNLVRIAPGAANSGGTNTTPVTTVPDPDRGEGDPLGLPDLPGDLLLHLNPFSN